MERTSSPSTPLGYRPSRRSFPNLQHLSLAPLSSRFPIEDDDLEQPSQSTRQFPPSTYISGKSAPPTPGILSRGGSPTRHRRRKSKHSQFADDDYLPTAGASRMTKAKSSTALARDGSRAEDATTAPFSPGFGRPSSKIKAGASRSKEEWIHRAGLAITSETRSIKGQSWLVSRDSSTALALSPSAESAYEGQQHQKIALMSGEHVIDEDDGPLTPRFYTPHNLSRAASRVNSRAGSRRGSRRGSKVGSKLELTGLTPLDMQSAAPWQADGYFDDIIAPPGAEPDFVDVEDEEELSGLDDEEVAHLARQRGFGIGGLVDRLVGWTLFNVDEDGEETAAEEEEDGQASAEDAARRRAAALKRRNEQLAKSAMNSARATQAGAAGPLPPPVQGEESAWKDAAWLLSVASKVIL